MDPITKVVDKTEELLGHSPHPAIVTVPLGAFVVSNVCDGIALADGDRRVRQRGLASAWPSAWSGPPAPW